MFCKTGDSKAGTEIHKVLQRVYSHSPVFKIADPNADSSSSFTD